MLRSRISARTTIIVLANAISVRVAVPANNEATQIRLHPAALFLSLPGLGGCHRTCQATKVFVVGGEGFDFLHKHCVGGVDQGDGGRGLVEHRLFFGGVLGQIIEISLKFLVFDGFPI